MILYYFSILGNKILSKKKIVDFCFIANNKLKIICNEKITKSEIIEAHRKKPFKWPANLGFFEFIENIYVVGMPERKNRSRPF